MKRSFLGPVCQRLGKKRLQLITVITTQFRFENSKILRTPMQLWLPSASRYDLFPSAHQLFITLREVAAAMPLTLKRSLVIFLLASMIAS